MRVRDGQRIRGPASDTFEVIHSDWTLDGFRRSPLPTFVQNLIRVSRIQYAILYDSQFQNSGESTEQPGARGGRAPSSTTVGNGVSGRLGGGWAQPPVCLAQGSGLRRLWGRPS